MTNEPRTPHKCPTCKASFTDDGEFAEHMGGQCTPSPADGIDARGLVERLRKEAESIQSWSSVRIDPRERTVSAAADLIEQLLAERAVAVQAGEKIGRAKGRASARKVSQRHAKHGARL